MNDQTNTSNLPPQTPDPSDAHIDATLRALAAHVTMPGEEPGVSTDAAQAADAPAPIPFAHAAEARRVRPHRRSRWLAAGSAAAAFVAAGAVLWTQSGRNEVRAAEILASLRQAQILGLDVELEGVGAEGATVDGVVRLRLRHPLAVTDIEDPAAWERAEFGALHARLRVATGPTAGQLAGMDLSVEGAFTPEVGWAFVQADDASVDRLIAEHPDAAVLANMARLGVVLNVGPVTEDMLSGLAIGAIADAGEPAPDAAGRMSVDAGVRIEPGPDGRGHSVKISARGKGPVPPDALARFADEGRRISEALEEAKRAKGAELTESEARLVAIRVRKESLQTMKDAIGDSVPEADRAEFEKAVAEIEAEVSREPTAQEQAMEQLGRGLITGRATQQDLDQIRALLNGQDQRATVRNLGGGKYELTAELKDNGSATPDAEMKVLYEQDAGVRWVEVRPLKDVTGTIRLTMAADPLDPALLDYQRLVVPGTTGYFDLRALQGLLGSFGADDPGAGPAPAGDDADTHPAE